MISYPLAIKGHFHTLPLLILSSYAHPYPHLYLHPRIIVLYLVSKTLFLTSSRKLISTSCLSSSLYLSNLTKSMKMSRLTVPCMDAK
jgi:hypothetical protein